MEGANPLNTLEDAFILQDVQSWSIQEHYLYQPSSPSSSSSMSPSTTSSSSSSKTKTKSYNLPSSKSPSGGLKAVTSSSSYLGLPAGSPLNGFIPQTAHLKRADAKVVDGEWKSGIEAFEKSVGEVFYETWKGGQAGNDVASSSSPSSPPHHQHRTTDESDSDSDSLSLILTGLSIPRPPCIPPNLSLQSTMPPGPNTTLHGTVRAYDGLITVRAAENNPNGWGVGGGAWVWNAYLVGEGNLVGRWRDGSVEVGRNAYEGVFVMRRRT